MPNVKCSVSNCQFWANGNNCHANNIMIEIDQHANLAYDTEFGLDFEDHKDQAASERSTCCHTFEPKK
ncbi:MULTISPECIES: DUF1540 domain-containing protein [Paenibacillus]|uniref:DUF1540 domain-containing protein n=1 Tax=Paenibacillus TaxID=44249 RepID=UPI0022B86895|nr:DUF1540 domain-containing protein [Paenibacillus caseinilyticus]MCZ8518737.1 DUF1540 domain-containing protein [Paenibacillus caseinilyticus]